MHDICLSTKSTGFCSSYHLGSFNWLRTNQKRCGQSSSSSSDGLRPNARHGKPWLRTRIDVLKNREPLFFISFIEFTSARSKLVFRLCLGSEQLNLLNECCAFRVFSPFRPLHLTKQKWVSR